jgi:outer membrane protein OmpA-like peptidoglycan-associated protein
MKRQPWILAGSAVALLMASAPLGALPLYGGAPARDLTGRLQPVQADCQEGESAEDCAARSAPAPEPAEQAAPQTEEAAPAEQPRRKQRKERKGGQESSTPAPEAAPATEEPAAVQEAAPEAAPAEQAEPETPRKKRKKAEPADAAPAEEASPAEAAPAPEDTPTQAKEPEAKPETPRKKRQKREQPAAAPEQEAAPSEPAAAPDTATTPVPKQKPAPAEQSAPAEAPAPAEQAAPAEEPPAQDQPVQGKAEPANPDAAPVLDSQKEGPTKSERRDRRKARGDKQQSGEDTEQAGAEAAPPAEAGRPPADDKAAQEAIQPEKIVPITREEGKRVERAPEADLSKRRRPEGADVKKLGDRLIIQFGGNTIVESNERPRMTRGARDVYYEDLPRGRTRETIVRGNGDQVVTIRDRDGFVIQRSRITPDGREYVLNYVDERHRENVREWRDPGEELPPMRLTIPRRQYILESEAVESPDEYYEFLEQPPVEKVQRLYSIEEVKRSARVRDIARRVDLDTLNFDFGSADISQEEAGKLQGVAEAMERLLEKNPAETFLIEGHTDAVGSDTANLALSDRRAEAVANALTDYFDIPPENLATQGYGERYLKVDTEEPERENRRVAIRRITPLVAPVASAQ